MKLYQTYTSPFPTRLLRNRNAGYLVGLSQQFLAEHAISVALGHLDGLRLDA